jgi:hypothetical protein
MTRLCLAALPFCAAVLAAAGTAEAQSAPSRTEPAPPQAEPKVDVDRLPLNLGRITRELRQSSERRETDGLNLRFQIDVFGQAPDIQLFTREDNLTTGPVPYGAPTHQQMLQMMTPKEFSAPVADFSALFRWLTEKTK